MDIIQDVDQPKVVILTSRFPYPLTKGDKLRLYHHIKTLSQRFNLYLICLSEQEPSKKDFEHLQRFCTRITVIVHPPFQRRIEVFFHFLGDLPLQVRYFFSETVLQQIESELQWIHPDHIHVHLLRMAPYIERLTYRCSASIDFMDNMSLNDLAGQYLSHPLLKWIKQRERKLIKSYEHKVASEIHPGYVISERDRIHFSPEVQSRLQVLKNGVDQSYYIPDYGNRTPSTYDLVFCGNLAYQPNQRAVYFILSELLPQLSNLKILIAGADLSKKQEKDYRQLFEKKSDGTNTLSIEGYRKDLRTVYWSGKIMVVPIFNGSGQQNKVLEAMACGIPCITTHFVNEGIQALEGRELLLAGEAGAFVSFIKDLLSHPERRKELSIAARNFIERKFDWTVNTKVLMTSIGKEISNE